MSSNFARCLVLGSAAMLALASPAMAQLSDANRSGRSANAQSDNQTTRQDDSQYTQDDQQLQQEQERAYEQRLTGQDAQTRQEARRDQGRLGQWRDDAQMRRQQRQERRQEAGATSPDREPAIGVTVVERGGMGVRVIRVAPNSPAAQANIRPGDTILEVDGQSVGTPRQLVDVIQQSEPGQTAELSVIRGGREVQIPIRLATREQALPPQMRQGDQFGQTWQQGQQRQWDERGQPQEWQQRQPQQFDRTAQYGSQQGQYDEQRWSDQQRQWDQEQYGQQRGQYGQQQDRFSQGQRPVPYAQGYRDQYSGTQQAYYGETGQGPPADQDPDRRFGGQVVERAQERMEDRQVERLLTRLERLEDRIEQLNQRLNEVQFEQEPSRQADRRSQQ